MSKKDKIFKICLITFITLIGVGAMTRFALSAEPAAIPATDQSPENAKVNSDVYQALNEIGAYLYFLNKIENGNLAPPAQTGAEPEPQEIKSSEYGSDVTLTVLNELALYFGKIKRMETAFSMDAENSEAKPATEPEHPTPEIIEISSNQNGELNYIKVTWDVQDNEH
jgi:hypothetical protein